MVYRKAEVCYDEFMISKEEVLRIAQLARIELTELEVEKMQKDLSSILEYFDILKKAPKINISHATTKRDLSEVTRIDVVDDCPASLANNIVGSAPHHRDGYIQVKSVL